MSDLPKRPASRRPWNACAARLCQPGPDSLYRPALGKWELVEDFEDTLEDGSRGKIKRGFLYDMASTPPLSWLLGFQPYALGERGPLWHDLLYRCGGDVPPEVGSLLRSDGSKRITTRKEADKILIDEARAEGVPEWKLRLVYAVLRAFGWAAWGGRA